LKIVTAYFHRADDYAKLLNVFTLSAQKHMPGIEIETVRFEVPMRKYGIDPKFNHHMDTYFAFMAKTRAALKYSDPVCISDNDIMFRGSIEDVWALDFDIAVTTRDHECHLNTGVFFSRQTPAAKQFIVEWLKHTEEIATLFDIDHISRHAGIDQAALFQTLEENKTAKVLFLPCQFWNAEQTCWKTITNDTRVVHIKSKLRLIIFGKMKINKKYSYLSNIVKEIESYANTKRSDPVHKPTKVWTARPYQRFHSRHR
jgi:hypothetical protein